MCPERTLVAVATPGEVPGSYQLNGLSLQTSLKALKAAKGHFSGVTNRPASAIAGAPCQPGRGPSNAVAYLSSEGHSKDEIEIQSAIFGVPISAIARSRPKSDFNAANC